MARSGSSSAESFSIHSIITCVSRSSPRLANKPFAQLLHLPPCRIGINGKKPIGQRAAAANRDAQVVHRIAGHVFAGLVGFFENALCPVAQSGLLLLRRCRRFV